MQPVGLIGLGLMGCALAARLLESDFEVASFDIDPAKTAAAAKTGVQPVDSAGDLAGRCNPVLVAVYDTAQVEEVVAGLQPAGRALTVICITTVEPAAIAALATAAKQSGIDLIECSISGTSAEVRSGTGVGLLGGSRGAIDGVSDVLDAICPQRFVVGAAGAAARAKLAINLVLQLNRAALAEGLVFAERLGLDAAEFLKTLRLSAAHSKVMDTKGDRMLRGDFSPQSRIAQTLKDAELILAQASGVEQRLPLMTVNAALLAEAVAQDGGRDSSAIIDAIRRRAT